MSDKVCYNCDGWGKVSIPYHDMCPDCDRQRGQCKCGSTADFISKFGIVPCPICKGAGIIQQQKQLSLL